MNPVVRKIGRGLLHVLAGLALLLIVLRHYGYFTEQEQVETPVSTETAPEQGE